MQPRASGRGRVLPLLSIVLLLSILLLGAHASTDGEPPFNSVKDIKAFMYKTMTFTGGWYRILNSTSAAVGSTNPIPGQVVSGVLMLASYVTWPLTEARVLVCTTDNYEQVLNELLGDEESAGHVVGVLVSSGGPLPAQLSSSEKFPGSWNAPYPEKNFPWNPSGSGLNRQAVNFPVIRITPSLVDDVLQRAEYNQQQGYSGSVYWADLTMFMAAQYNSTYCLQPAVSTCKPLGGFSVWAAMPPMAPLYPDMTAAEIRQGNGNGSLPVPSSMPLTLVTAQIDADSLFHDYTQACEASLSGLITMMAAMSILRDTGQAATYTRQLAFLALAGEPWDYMGSRRLLLEIEYNSTSVAGLNMSNLDQIIEVGQVGRGYSEASNSSSFYLHAQKPGTGFGDPNPLIATLQQAAALTTEAQVTVAPASSSTPGIPPSSLMSFLRVKPSIQGVVLADYDTAFSKYHFTDFDNGTFVFIEPMVSAAIVLARSLHALAAPPGAPPVVVNYTKITEFVQLVAWCLMIDGQPPFYSLRCSLVSSFIQVGYSDSNAEGVVQPYPWRYIGLAEPGTDDPTNITYKRDIFRYVWNQMANISASQHLDIACDPFVNVCSAGQVCVGWLAGQDSATSAATMGRCKVATAKFVMSTSTRVLYGQNADLSWYRTLVGEWADWNAKYSWPPDPLWSESDWSASSPTFRVYMVEDTNVQVYILISGILLTLATGVAVYLMQRVFEHRLKSD